MGHSDTPFYFFGLRLLCQCLLRSHHTPIYTYLTTSVHPSYPLPHPFTLTSTTPSYVAEPDQIILV